MEVFRNIPPVDNRHPVDVVVEEQVDRCSKLNAHYSATTIIWTALVWSAQKDSARKSICFMSTKLLRCSSMYSRMMSAKIFTTAGSTKKLLQLPHSIRVPSFGILTVICFFHSIGKYQILRLQRKVLQDNFVAVCCWLRYYSLNYCLEVQTFLVLWTVILWPLQLYIIMIEEPNVKVSDRRRPASYSVTWDTVLHVICSNFFLSDQSNNKCSFDTVLTILTSRNSIVARVHHACYYSQ